MFDKSLRLYYVSCYLNHKGIIRYRDPSFDSKISVVVSEWNNWNDVIRGLRKVKATSQYYNEVNLKVDCWYLNRENYVNISKQDCGSTDPEGSVLFQVIVRSLLDLKNGRPCDIGSWRCDESPDEHCIKSNHVCYHYAEWYLSGVDEETELFCGLKCGQVDDLVKCLKRGQIFDYLTSLGLA